MGRRGKIRYLLTGSYTRLGYYSFVPDLIQGIQKLWILTGPVGSGKSYFIRSLGEELANKGYEVEFWLSAIESGSVEGVYLPQIQAAVVKGSQLCPTDGHYPDVNGEIINLCRGLKEDRSRTGQLDVGPLAGRLQEHSRRVQQLIQEAVALEDRQNLYTGGRFENSQLQELVEEIEGALFKPEPEERHYFGLALTVDGIVNYLQEASGDCRRRYILLGPPGCGQERVIQQIAAKAARDGYHREFFYQALDPQRPCMLLIRELQVALIEAGQLHLTNQPGDVIINMSRNLKDAADDPLHSDLEDWPHRTDAILSQAQMELEEIYRLNKLLERAQASAVDFEWVDSRREETLRKIIQTS